MTEAGDAKLDVSAADQYDIIESPGQFAVRFVSPYNTLHQISGFQSRDEALAWISETGKLARFYS